mmetsp:Transcript_26070/g.66324  ORF Transcript_26070/g.66324 Transcript_26070/m.66324 type:complete len:245 (+) Transcript_26070:104-838(+)
METAPPHGEKRASPAWGGLMPHTAHMLSTSRVRSTVLWHLCSLLPLRVGLLSSPSSLVVRLSAPDAGGTCPACCCWVLPASVGSGHCSAGCAVPLPSAAAAPGAGVTCIWAARMPPCSAMDEGCSAIRPPASRALLSAAAAAAAAARPDTPCPTLEADAAQAEAATSLCTRCCNASIGDRGAARGALRRPNRMPLSAASPLLPLLLHGPVLPPALSSACCACSTMLCWFCTPESASSSGVPEKL